MAPGLAAQHVKPTSARLMSQPVDLGEVAGPDELAVVQGMHAPVDGAALGHLVDLARDNVGDHVRIVDHAHVPEGHDLGVGHQREDVIGVLGEAERRRAAAAPSLEGSAGGIGVEVENSSTRAGESLSGDCDTRP